MPNLSERYPYGILKTVVPSGGGWRFPYPEDDARKLQDKMIRAGSWDSLISKIRTFRIQAGIKIGDVEFEASEYIKKVSPGNNRHPDRKYEPRPEGRPDHRPNIEQALEWLVMMGRAPKRLVLTDDAMERAKKCSACPQNVPWQSRCEPCNEDLIFRGQNIRQRPAFKADKELNFCRLHGIYLPVAVFLDQDHLAARHADAPPACWMPEKVTALNL